MDSLPQATRAAPLAVRAATWLGDEEAVSVIADHHGCRHEVRLRPGPGSLPGKRPSSFTGIKHVLTLMCQDVLVVGHIEGTSPRDLAASVQKR